MTRLRGARRGSAILFAALVAGICVAACGSSNASSTTSKTTASSTSAKRAEFTACLKKAGVDFAAGSFKRRTGTGGTFTRPSGAAPTGTGTTRHFTPPAGGTGTTRKSTPPAGGFTHGATGFTHGATSKDAKAVEACAKKYGVTQRAGFRGGYGGHGGTGTTSAAQFTTAELDKFVACVRKNGYSAMPEPYSTSKTVAFPKSVESNAKFKAASAKCYTDLRPAYPAGGGAPPAGGSTTTAASTSTTSST